MSANQNCSFIISICILYTLCIMPRPRTGPGNESHKNKAGRLGFAF